MREKDVEQGAGVVARPGKRKKHLKPYTTLYESNRRDVAKTLRVIAKEVERGDFKDVDRAALVLDSQDGKFNLFHFGPRADGVRDTLALFDLAMGELRGIIYDAKERQALQNDT